MSEKTRHRGVLAASLLAAGLGIGCGGAASPEPCGVRPRKVAHACVHGSAGPFQPVRAASPGGQPGPALDQTHTVFQVELARLPGDHFGGEILFRPRRTGAHALLTDKAVILEARQEGRGWERARFTTLDTGCRSFPALHVFSFEGERPVTIAFGPQEGRRVDLLFEWLAGTVAGALVTSCPVARGDGGGRAETDAAVAEDASVLPDAAGSDAEAPGGVCRSEGPCSTDAECCGYCHDGDHCH